MFKIILIHLIAFILQLFENSLNKVVQLLSFDELCVDFSAQGRFSKYRQIKIVLISCGPLFVTVEFV
jgi:hypothetical protein